MVTLTATASCRLLMSSRHLNCSSSAKLEALPERCHPHRAACAIGDRSSSILLSMASSRWRMCNISCTRLPASSASRIISGLSAPGLPQSRAPFRTLSSASISLTTTAAPAPTSPLSAWKLHDRQVPLQTCPKASIWATRRQVIGSRRPQVTRMATLRSRFAHQT